MSRYCTSFPQTALGRHIPRTAFPTGREKSGEICQIRESNMPPAGRGTHINHIPHACMLSTTLTEPYSSPLLFMARYRPLSTPRMLTSPTARLMNSRIPAHKHIESIHLTKCLLRIYIAAQLKIFFLLSNWTLNLWEEKKKET